MHVSMYTTGRLPNSMRDDGGGHADALIPASMKPAEKGPGIPDTAKITGCMEMDEREGGDTCDGCIEESPFCTILCPCMLARVTAQALQDKEPNNKDCCITHPMLPGAVSGLGCMLSVILPIVVSPFAAMAYLAAPLTTCYLQTASQTKSHPGCCWLLSCHCIMAPIYYYRVTGNNSHKNPPVGDTNDSGKAYQWGLGSTNADDTPEKFERYDRNGDRY
jgi:hypothetical protein